MEINSNAPVTSCHDITMNAPLETVWRVHTQINGWFRLES
jgi:ligand-binding SRPBCC domain-containing protein